MKQKLKAISAGYELDWYTNAKNIPNQELVRDTIQFFETGEGAKLFKPLEFLNLHRKQYQFINENRKEPDKVMNHLNGLPLSKREKHTLFGFLLKWFGGYPVQYFDEETEPLFLIENEFLAFEGETVEKEYCKANSEKRKEMDKLGIAFNTHFKTGLGVVEILNGINGGNSKAETFNSFQEMFEDAYHNITSGAIENTVIFHNESARYNFNFNNWLKEEKSWNGNPKLYKNFLNRSVFEEFLKVDKSNYQIDRFLQSQTPEEAFRAYQDAFNQLREKFRLKRQATPEDCQAWPRLRVGDIISYNPVYKDGREAFTQLSDYYGMAYFELEKAQIVQKYRVVNAATVRAEIEKLEAFISDAEKADLTQACESFGRYDDRDHFVYLRLNNGFYPELKASEFPLISTIGNPEARVYGRYFHFYEYLKSTLVELIEPTCKNAGELIEAMQKDGINLTPKKVEFTPDGSIKGATFEIPGNKQIVTRFQLTSFLKEHEQAKQTYISLKSRIESDGFITLNAEEATVKIYTPELAVILTTKALAALNMETDTESEINGIEYLASYIKGYKDGEQHFETEFKVSPDTLYGVNAEQYVKDIHLNFFHVRHMGLNEGWGFVKTQYPIILTHKAVKEFGYYSGIVNKVEEQIKKYPQLFATFDKCEHSPQPTNDKPVNRLKSGKNGKNTEAFVPRLFSEIMNKPVLLEACLNLLRDAVCINDNNEFIGKKGKKGVVIVWLLAMDKKGMFKSGSFGSESTKAATLNLNFSGLGVNAATFGKGLQNAKVDYESLFEGEIAAIKNQ